MLPRAAAALVLLLMPRARDHEARVGHVDRNDVLDSAVDEDGGIYVVSAVLSRRHSLGFQFAWQPLQLGW